MTQSEIFETIKSLIPSDMWEKYSHLSFGEMADIPELEEWSDALRQAERDWFEANDA
jgi:hypothetical protein